MPSQVVQSPQFSAIEGYLGLLNVRQQGSPVDLSHAVEPPSFHLPGSAHLPDVVEVVSAEFSGLVDCEPFFVHGDLTCFELPCQIGAVLSIQE